MILDDFEYDGRFYKGMDTDNVSDVSTMVNAGVNVEEKVTNQTSLNADNVAREYSKMNSNYNGVNISLTNDDANALLQIEAAFRYGETTTMMHFANGTVMEVTSANFNDLAQWVTKERNKLFKPTV